MANAPAWALVLAAGLLEVGMAVALKSSDGWTRPLPSALALAAALGSIYLLASAVRALPLGVAYAVWTGIGALGVSLAGLFLFAEPLSIGRLFCMTLIFVGIAGLRTL
jgi:quaternary ammonium compound-resistance protein SugE